MKNLTALSTRSTTSMTSSLGDDLAAVEFSSIHYHYHLPISQIGEYMTERLTALSILSMGSATSMTGLAAGDLAFTVL